MNIAHSIPSEVAGISFSFLNSDEIRKISVKQVVNPVLLDDLNRPTLGGLYDPLLGPSERHDICKTCRLTYFTCPGHFGHIELPSPVFHPLFMINAYNLLRGTCLFCHKFKMGATTVVKYEAKLTMLDHGILDAVAEIDAMERVVTKKKKAEDDEDIPQDGEEVNETVEEFAHRVRRYVKRRLKGGTSSRDNYKDDLVYIARKQVIQEFLKDTIRKRCHNEDCGCAAYTFRKEGHTKIIELDLSPKEKGRLLKSRPDVLRESVPTANGDVEMVDPDSEGEGTDLDSDTGSNKAGHHDQTARTASGKVKGRRGRNERVISAEECRAHLRRLFRNERRMCGLLYGRHGPFARLNGKGHITASADMFFLDVLPVPPTRFRPPAKMNDTLFEHAQNELLTQVLHTCYRLRDLNLELAEASQKYPDFNPAEQHRITSAMLETLIQLQVNVNSFMDSSKNPAPVRQGKLPPAGVKQGLERKEGLFRKNMMGKRVNYAARSVISPDVNIEPNEIGIPPIFARKLTFPEPVTAANVHELRQLVIAGSHGYPGASMIEYEDGHQVSLDKLNEGQRSALASQLLTPQDVQKPTSNRRGLYTRTPAINKKVYRHLRDGDILILNRQPTLHKPSMMAHRARVLQGEKTIRMHYANCNSYNADFDGDEMNIHFPQNQVARAEAELIANTDNQYLVPTSGNPLRGLIQDHVVAGVWMTCKDAFFTREQYYQLLYGALRPDNDGQSIITIPPAIWKPVPTWTGKQIISTVLRNIKPSRMKGLNLTANPKLEGELWSADPKTENVLIMDGELLSGILDKASFGASEYGLVHSVCELYGAEIAGKLLGILSRLFTKFLQHRAFTCRIDDLILTADGDRRRAEAIEKGRGLGTKGAIKTFSSLNDLPIDQASTALRTLLQDILSDDKRMAALDVMVKNELATLTTNISDASLPHLFRKFPHNNMQCMTKSGAKGSPVNARQITCALGQQELEGRRVPVMISGKTLPSFKPFETNAIAGGYVASRFLTGVRPQEFYFHCMAGREGLIDTAVKTSRSGYLQRCLIKHLEGLRVHYDHTVRGSDNSVYQFCYGGDALDVTKQKYLREFEFIIRNHDSYVVVLNPIVANDRIDSSEAKRYMAKVLRRDNVRASKGMHAPRDKYTPALFLYSPSCYLGSTSEDFAIDVNEYIEKNPGGIIRRKDDEFPPSTSWLAPSILKEKEFRMLMNFKYMRSLVDPGEAVGLLASQGVGEPSTQMTLNTFHFAGHGAANVTLGIPRLREIVMTASRKPKTPSMTMKVCPGIPQDEIDSFCKRAAKLALSQVVEKVSVIEELATVADSRRRRFTINIDFFPPAEYQADYEVLPQDILACFATRFPLFLKREILLEMKRQPEDLRAQIAEIGKGMRQRGNVEAAEDADTQEEQGNGVKRIDDESSEAGDGDADDAKRSRQRKQQATYDEDDDGDAEEIIDEEGNVIQDADVASGEEPEPPDEVLDLTKETQSVAETFKKNMSYCTDFTFDDSHCSFTLEFGSSMPKLLLVSVIERTCCKTVIREIPGITDCFQVKSSGKENHIKLTTNGSNFGSLRLFLSRSTVPIIDDDDIYSNDIYGILTTYGVEMARAAIVREMSDIFSMYKIQVDRRHLTLIADYMTFDGGYRPFNRKGISSSSSPLLKASYETTAAFLSDATLYGDYDNLSTPSGRIVLGRPSTVGTGSFDIVMSVA